MANLNQICDYIADNMSEIIYEDRGSGSAMSFSAGTAGTYATVRNLGVSKTGYKPISAMLCDINHGSSYYVIPDLKRSTETVECIVYRAISSAYTIPQNDFYIRVGYIKE